MSKVIPTLRLGARSKVDTYQFPHDFSLLASQPIALPESGIIVFESAVVCNRDRMINEIVVSLPTTASAQPGIGRGLLPSDQIRDHIAIGYLAINLKSDK